MKVDDFTYELPAECIAQEPAAERDASRLCVLHRRTGRQEYRTFREIVEYLVPGDLLVLNDTRVIPARLRGRFAEGGEVEILFLRETETGAWEVLLTPSRAARPGRRILLAQGAVTATVEERAAGGRILLCVEYEGTARDLLERCGEVPLPPYIRRSTGETFLSDRERYQTVYAAADGAIAAPTAGLHFTPALLQDLQARGIACAFLTLHVGVGTFQPVRVSAVEEHRMEEERYVILEETAAAVKAAKASGRRVIAVGTTTVRALEDAARASGEVRAGEGIARTFIYPGYRMKIVDALLTNFHLPRSTLLMLVSAVASRELILATYREAIARGYRFYSYGDAMLIV